MPIRNRRQEIDLSTVRLKIGSTSKYGTEMQIMIGREEVGSLDFSTDLKITKQELIDNYEGNVFLKKLFQRVPDSYRFNHYYLDEIILWSSYRGTGIGAVAMQLWFATLKEPACVTLTPARIGNVPYQALLRFYRRNGFKLFKQNGDWAAITFIKSK